METRARGPRPPDAAAAAEALGLGRVLGAPAVSARGDMGRIWRLETTTGRWALKEVFRPEPDAAERARADAAFQLAAIDAGVHLPRPVVGPDGRVLIEVGPADDRRSVRAYAWADLRDRSAIVSLQDVAAILGRLHALAIPDDRPMLSWYRDPVDPATWPGLVARATAAGAGWATTLEELVPDLVATTRIAREGSAATEPSTPRIICHLDLNPENVLLDSSGRPVVIDWENAGPAFAEQELASVMAEFVADPTDTERFLRAYVGGGGTARIHDRSSFAMTVIVQAALVRIYAERALDGSLDDETRARSAFWIEDIAAHFFTVERIDRWIEAADRAGLRASG